MFMKAALSVFLGFVFLIIYSCSAQPGSNGGNSSSSSISKGSITIHFGISGNSGSYVNTSISKTVVANFSNAVDTYSVSLASQNGFSTKTATVSAASNSITFSNVEVGTWDISVNALKSGLSAGTGSLSNQNLTSGATLNLTIPIIFSQTAGTGNMSLTVQFPVSTGINYISGTIAGTNLIPVITTCSTNSNYYQAAFSLASINSGYQSLVMTFMRGGASGTTAGIFRESVNIWNNVTSDQWIDPNGNLVPVRVFSANEFYNANASLSGLSLSAGTLLFSSSTTNYNTGNVNISGTTVTPTGSISGQYIQYSVNSGSWNYIESGTTSGILPLNPGLNNISVKVTAPDKQNVMTYSILISNAYTINSSADVNGSITPSGNVAVNPGANQGYTITPNTGFQVSNVTVDGVSQGAVTSYTFTNVQANHTISVTFMLIPYTITANAGANGSISPSGSVAVNYDSSQSFTITPNTGYQISNVAVDGVSQGIITSYTFTNVQANHTISAGFKPLTGTVIIGFTISNPNYQAVTFATNSITIARGQTLTLSTTNQNLTGLSGWNWYVDNVQDSAQTTSTYSWNSTGKQPGQYIINMDVVYNSIDYSGSLIVTVVSGYSITFNPGGGSGTMQSSNNSRRFNGKSDF